MKRLADIVGDCDASGVYLLEESARLTELTNLTQDKYVIFFLLQGAELESKRQFLKHAAEVLKFPDYFGNNWDAFEDCLKDLAWHKQARGYVILYESIDAFARKSSHEFRTLLDIFKESATFWRKNGKPFLVILQGSVPEGLDIDRVGW